MIIAVINCYNIYLKALIGGVYQLAARILIIDDKENIRRLLATDLMSKGYQVDTAEDGLSGLECFKEVIYDLVITDVKMPVMSGLEVLEGVKEISPDTAVIVMTAFADMDDAILALKQGAADYLRKPFKLEEIRTAVEKALETRNLIVENRLLRREVEDKYKFSQIVSRSKAMDNVIEAIKRLAGDTTLTFSTAIRNLSI